MMTAGQTPQTAEDFRTAMRHVAASVTIVEAALGSERRGLTATAVCSLSLDPPALIVCVNRRADACELIKHSRCFSVNVLKHDQEDLARCFGGEGPRGAERFAAGRWLAAASGAPILQGSLASFDCTLTQALAFTTHDILIGEAVDVRFDGSVDPLLYRNRQYLRIH